MDIPLIDLAAFDEADPTASRRIVEAWRGAFATVGFAAITGHGVPEDLSQRLYVAAQRFFDLPLAAKRACLFPGFQRSQGYVPPNAETVAASWGTETPPDLCESLSFADIDRDGAPDHRANLWPTEPADLRPLAIEYWSLTRRLALRLMRLSALALDLPADYFDVSHSRMTTNLRLVDYPDQTTPPLPGQLRYGAHTDFGGFTILRQDQAQGGLQVLMPSGDWVDVRPTLGTLIINAGDALARWTNGRFRSNPHRVINPPRDLTGSTRRTSIVLFTGPNPGTVIACLPGCGPAIHPPVTIDDFVTAKIRAGIAKPLE